MPDKLIGCGDDLANWFDNQGKVILIKKFSSKSFARL